MSIFRADVLLIRQKPYTISWKYTYILYIKKKTRVNYNRCFDLPLERDQDAWHKSVTSTLNTTFFKTSEYICTYIWTTKTKQKVQQKN